MILHNNGNSFEISTIKVLSLFNEHITNIFNINNEKRIESKILQLKILISDVVRYKQSKHEKYGGNHNIY